MDLVVESVRRHPFVGGARSRNSHVSSHDVRNNLVLIAIIAVGAVGVVVLLLATVLLIRFWLFCIEEWVEEQKDQMNIDFFKKPQVWAILLFVVLFFWGLTAHAKNSLEVGLSFGAFHSTQMITQRIGWNYDNRWIAQYERHGGNGYQGTNSVSIQRQVSWRQGSALSPLLRFGISYFDEQIVDPEKEDRPLVSENLTYSLGFGVRIKERLMIGLEHNSTAGRSARNRGIDRFYLTFQMPV